MMNGSYPPRRKKTAAERRAQYDRAHGRAIQAVVKSLQAVQSHRGGQLSSQGRVLLDALYRPAGSTIGSRATQPVVLSPTPPEAACSSASMEPLSPTTGASRLEASTQQLCQHHAMGHCWFGASCWYRHGDARVHDAMPAPWWTDPLGEGCARTELATTDAAEVRSHSSGHSAALPTQACSSRGAAEAPALSHATDPPIGSATTFLAFNESVFLVARAQPIPASDDDDDSPAADFVHNGVTETVGGSEHSQYSTMSSHMFQTDRRRDESDDVVGNIPTATAATSGSQPGCPMHASAVLVPLTINVQGHGVYKLHINLDQKAADIADFVEQVTGDAVTSMSTIGNRISSSDSIQLLVSMGLIAIDPTVADDTDDTGVHHTLTRSDNCVHVCCDVLS